MKILFVCSGNTGRSPMAEFIMRKLINDAGLSEKISVDSAATKEVKKGDHLHQGIAAKLRTENIPFEVHIARTITKDDYNSSDMIVCMDDGNVAQVKTIFGGDPDKKISKLLEAGIPWNNNNFNTMFDDIKRGCEELLKKVGG